MADEKKMQADNAVTVVVSPPPATKGNTVKIDTPLDYSFMKLINPADLLVEKPRGAKELPANSDKYPSKSIKLNNNHLQDIADLQNVISQVIIRPEEITWIDLSFNQLSHIDPVLCRFPRLNILYLHGNRIDEVSEVDKLGSISTLRKLALHGNTLEKAPNYRCYVLSRIPQLISLDMSSVTHADRANTARFFKNKTSSHGPRRSKHVEE